jgi:hypothetical protein
MFHRSRKDPDLSRYVVASLESIAQPGDAIFTCTMIAAVKRAVFLKTVPNYSRSAMLACGRQGVNRALEAVERVSFAPHDHFEGLVVAIAAGFACRHEVSPGTMEIPV